MFRPTLTALVLGLAAAPASAFDIDQMSDNERAIFRSEIRDYLLENPEVLMEAIGVLEQRRADQAAAQEQVLLEEYREEIFDDGFSWVGGNPDGDVTVVEFLDYRCGYCKRAHPEVLELLESDGNIRFIVKEFPILGPQSELAARYAIAAKMLEGDEVYGVLHDALMTWDGEINEGALARVGRSAGVGDHEAVLTKMQGDEVSGIIAANRALGQALQIQGTPSFVMGDNFVRGYVELKQMRAIVAGIREEQG